MNIHEYQARELFQKFGVPTARGNVASSPEEVESVAKSIGAPKLVVKSQIHAGGRGKGHFANGFQGGVHLCHTPAEAGEIAWKMLGQPLITHQTGPEGRVVNKVLVVEAIEIERELYFAIVLDRASGAPLIIASTEGGVEIETVAESTPERIMREPIHPALGLQPHQTRKLAKQLGLSSQQLPAATKLFTSLYKLFIACDCSQLEINPLVVTKTGVIMPWMRNSISTTTPSSGIRKSSRCATSSKKTPAKWPPPDSI